MLRKLTKCSMAEGSSSKLSVMLATLPLLLVLSSCNALNNKGENLKNTVTVADIVTLNPLREPKVADPVAAFTAENIHYKTQIKSGPGVNITSTVADAQAKELSLPLTGEAISANYHDMPLPIFINEVFGEQLHLSFSTDPQINKQGDLVTLRVAEPVPPAELFHIALRTLSSYGIAASQQNGVLSFVIDKNASAGETPLLMSGRTLPDTPAASRPIFMFVPLKAVSNTKVASWVASALSGKDIKVTEDAVRNAVMLSGKPDLVRQALAIIDVLDQPLMRGKFSLNIEPAFVKVADLSKNLQAVLNGEGYDATIKSVTGSIIIIPLEGTNQLVVFAGSQAILDHVHEWVNTLDRRQQMSIDQGIFTYEVRNTEATHIVELLNGVETGAATGGTSTSRPSTATGSAVSDTTTATSNTTSAVGASGKISGGNFAVDTNRNTIIFKGSGQAWADLLPVIQTLDKSAPSVLIEVLLAEVTLDDKENAGIEFVKKSWLSNNGAQYGTSIATQTYGKAATSLLATLNSAGSTKATLNLFQENSRVEIRSRPRLMVKSGQQASIDVGTEVPTLGASSGAITGGVVLPPSITPRKTGVRLTVKPTVHASGNIDIDIDQELSEALDAKAGGINSPSIFNRQIKTMVTLQDGGSILLGGLISDSKSKGKTGVPTLSKIPLLGRLFSADSKSTKRTELMVMIIPYVIDSPAEGQAITKTIQEAFGR